MHLPAAATAVLGFAALLHSAIAAGSSSASASSSVSPSTTVTFRVPAGPHLANPFALPPATHATLSSLGKSLSAPLSAANAFVFRNVTAGSYLVDVHCPTHAFIPLRLDVLRPVDEDGSGSASGLVLRAWETYRGNDWDNKGEAVALREGGAFDVRSYGAKDYFAERSSFSVFSILKNPMILLGLVSMGIFFGMPYLVNNMDPEMRAEYEERQKTSTMNSLLTGGGAQSGANPMGNFDMAAFLAGAPSKKEDGGNGAGSSPGPAAAGGSKKGGKR